MCMRVVAEGYCCKTVHVGEETQPQYLYRFRMPGLTVDTVPLGRTTEGEVCVLVVQRGVRTEPVEFRGRWAFAGGFLNYGQENDVQAAGRECYEETGAALDEKQHAYLIRLTVASDAARDPRGHMVSSVFLRVLGAPVVKSDVLHTADAEEIAGSQWWPLQDALRMPLAFDHSALLQRAVDVYTYLESLTSDVREGVLKFAQMQM